MGSLEGSTILLQYSSITRTPLESSWLGELKYAISAGKDIILKNKSIVKCKKMTARRAYMVTVLWTGLDRFVQVWASQNRCEVLFFCNRESHALQIWPIPKTCVQFSNYTSLETLRLSEVVETAFRHASIGVRCEPVWSATFLGCTSTGDTALESSRLAQLKYEISM